VSEAPKPGSISGGDAAEQRVSSRFVRPQAMRNLTNEQRAEERTSTWLELFFDLCFVVAVAALASGLHEEPNLDGMLRFLGLFVPVWWSWMIFTWYATAFDNDDVPYRVTLLVAMLSILGLAASVGRIGVDPAAAVSFVLAYSLMRLLVASSTSTLLGTSSEPPSGSRRCSCLLPGGTRSGVSDSLWSSWVPYSP
jgi:low temperature requirement protein LtrA